MSNKYQLISYNKDYISSDSFRLDTNNRAFRYGDGFFETMRANGLEVQFIKHHYERIVKAADILKLNLPDFFNIEFLKKQVAGLLSRKKIFQAARVKLSIYRIGDGYYIPKSDSSDILIEAEYLGKGVYELNTKGVSVGIYSDMPKPKSLYSVIKSINAQFYILAGIYAKNNKFDDALILNDRGLIIEATSSNIFAVKDSVIITPPLESGCVDGIMRRQIIAIAEYIRYSIVFESIKVSDLSKMDELFLTNAVVGIRYISGYNNRRYFKRISTKLMYELNNQAFYPPIL